MNEPTHIMSARSTATLENEGRLKVGKQKRRRFLKNRIKKVVNKNKYDV